jgi:formylglycine-generating enzyme required for sulfatase activity
MAQSTREEELEAQLVALQRQLAELQQQRALQPGAAQGTTIQQSGSGGIAQGVGAKASGAGSVVADQIHGNVYMGKPPQDEREKLAIYRRVYGAACRALPLRGIDIGASDAAGEQQRLDLDQVYIALDTTTPVERNAGKGKGKQPSPPVLGEEEKAVALSLLDAVIEKRRIVILGGPGSGKSTFLNHLGLCLALQGSEPEQNWLRRLPNWSQSEATLLPIAVTLRDFAQTMTATSEEATPQPLWRFISSRLQAQNLGFVSDALHQALEVGEAIVLLDGLDEIPTAHQRRFVRDSVAAFADRYPRTRLLVTCRTLSYQDSAWQLGKLPFVTIAPFDQEKIKAFITAWYDTLARLNVMTQAEAERLAQRLQEAIGRPELRDLADNPLLLTVMALVHTHRGRLPDARALLYEETVDILLWRWEEIKVAAGTGTAPLRRLLHEANRADVDFKRTLWQLAYTVQGQRTAGAEDGLADIHEFTLQKALTELHPDRDRNWAYALIQAIKLRAGLLLERAPEVYTFPHRTFQEYLAGCHLAAAGKFAQTAASLAAEGAFWRQTILLAVGRLVYLGGDTDKPLALVGELCPRRTPTTDQEWRNIWLAGDVLLEMGLHRVRDSALGLDLLERVQQRLVALLQAGALAAGERAAAGDVLAQVGDPRFAADAWYLPAEPLLGFIEVPAGPFIMGRDPAVEEEVKAWEQPHEVALPTYYMARYPVTVAQFRAFCDDSGYQPKDGDSLRDPDNRPVRWITWHEAQRYCAWLTETLRTWAGTPEPLATLLRSGADGSPPWRITLPSEAEWEKAARGASAGADTVRIYPWGNEPNPTAVNCAETGLITTSVVGAFPGGVSPYGCLDMAGNVWEWTRSLWGEDYRKPDFGYPYNPRDGREKLEASNAVLRVLRGGSYYERGGAVGCGARDWVNPDYSNGVVGFRIVASPSTSGR